MHLLRKWMGRYNALSKGDFDDYKNKEGKERSPFHLH